LKSKKGPFEWLAGVSWKSQCI